MKDENLLEHHLLENSLDISENDFIFLGGFDEINNDYTAKCLKLFLAFSDF